MFVFFKYISCQSLSCSNTIFLFFQLNPRTPLQTFPSLSCEVRIKADPGTSTYLAEEEKELSLVLQLFFLFLQDWCWRRAATLRGLTFAYIFRKCISIEGCERAWMLVSTRHRRQQVSASFSFWEALVLLCFMTTFQLTLACAKQRVAFRQGWATIHQQLQNHLPLETGNSRDWWIRRIWISWGLGTF